MRILVIGGGIAGMATSIALEQAGFDPLVLEQAPEVSEIGSGISLQANGMRVMAQLGSADHVRGTGVPIDTNAWYRLDGGQKVFTESYKAKAERYGGIYVLCMHRADLLDSLAKRVPSERIRLNARVGRWRSARMVSSQRSRAARRSSATSWWAPTACAPQCARSSSASRRRASPASPHGAARPRRRHAARLRASVRDVGGSGPSRDDLSDPG